MKRTIVFALAAFFFFVAGIAPLARAPLTFEERVKAQEAIERVYYSHRIWPKENPTPKPPFEEMVPREVLEAKVTDYLKKCVALDQYWQRPITAEQLQAEMDRMAQGTKDPETLRKLFAALGNDSYLVAECLARPVLACRLLENWYSMDGRFHGEMWDLAEKAFEGLSSQNFYAAPGSEYQKVEYRLAGSIESGISLCPAEDSRFLILTEREFNHVLNHSPAEGQLSQIEETKDAFVIRHTIRATPDRVVEELLRFAKRPLDAWLEGLQVGPSCLDSAAPDARLSLPPISSMTCADGWDNGILDDLPDARGGHTAVWSGTEMIVWGGGDYTVTMNTGGRYTPATDSWASTSTGTNVPSARGGHTAVWTGLEMVVWGGEQGGGNLNSGGRYNPLTDSWTPTSTGTNVPSARLFHTAVWTGSEMIVWGGGLSNTGARYNPSTDSWVPTSTGPDVPSSRNGHTSVWTGSEMIVFGGYDEATVFLATGGRYSPSTDSWIPTSTGANVPEGRYGHTAVWTDAEMIVWGGGTYPHLNTGGRYNPITNSWLPTALGANVPTSRAGHTAVWTGLEMIVWGGEFGSTLNTGGRYNPTTNSWAATSSASNAPSGRKNHTSVWTGSEMVVWGGYDSSGGHRNDGSRYNPSTNSWIPTSLGTGPSFRYGHSAVWSGSEMIVWGGFGASYTNTGGRYSPSTDSWTATSTGTGVPSKRYMHRALWTGSEMIVWGGCSYSGTWTYLNTGGRYNPAANSWNPTATGTDVPSARSSHTAVWTGSEMIVWGGGDASDNFNSGGRYSPVSNSWVATSTGTNVPTARWGHASVWTGSEMITWGGNGYLNNGGRYQPASDSWFPMSTGAGVPTGRILHTAVWTGAEAIFWGGWTSSSSTDRNGGRYNPSTDSWVPTSIGANVPAARRNHTAVWTGSEMVVWGGVTYSSALINSGGRYYPETDSWVATSMAPGVPSAREQHTAVWTGSEMIIWGGSSSNPYSGGRYTRCACTLACSASATPTSGIAPLSVSFEGDATSSDCTGAVTYAWKFGDGAVSNLKDTTHIYTTAGSYTWTLIASAAGGSCSRSGTITATGNCSMTCSATAPSQGIVGQAVSFKGSATPSNCTGSPTFAWSFGDGQTSSQQNPSHTYTAAGTYSWSMTATVEGVTCTKSGTIAVAAPCSLTCTATAVPASGAAPLSVTFSASATASNCTGGVTYSWDFGDGASSTQKNASHTYTSDGTFTWTMTATVQGVSCSKTGTISVTEPCSVACSATASPTSGAQPLQVSFSGSATPEHCTVTPVFAWAFGDGGTTTEQNPTHTYTSTGTFTWTLTVTVDGETCAKTGTVTVGEPCAVTCTATVPAEGRAGDVVAFSAATEASHCSGSPTYAWSYGDGGTSTEQNPSHIYAVTGSFPWTLTVTVDDQTCTQNGTVAVSEGCAVTCTASATPASGEAPLAVAFTASATTPNCLGEAAYAWSFGDGGASSEQSPSHSYAEPGTYGWTLTVTAEGRTCTQTGTVTVVPPCVLTCEASATPDHGSAPLAVAFAATVEASDCPGSPAFLWSFGDGANSSEQNPNHTYTTPGTYTWTLTVTSGSATCGKSGAAIVNPGLPGDANNDGVVSIGEVQQAINMFLGTQPPGNGVDCNGDGSVSIGEVQKVINAFLGLPSSC